MAAEDLVIARARVQTDRCVAWSGGVVQELLDFVARSVWIESGSGNSKGELTFIVLAVAASILVVILFAIAS
jgi:hypothetical protein